MEKPETGEVWRHDKTDGLYTISGTVFNTVTDRWDVLYKPMYPCEIGEFSRQREGHEKSFMRRFSFVRSCN